MKTSVLLLALVATFAVRAEVIAFIGAPLAVERSGDSCMDYTEQPDPATGGQVICTSSVFNLTYKIDEVLRGSVAADTIKFIGFYHYSGMPQYTMYAPALLILSREMGHLQLRYIEQADLRDESWWVCDEWAETEDWECIKERNSQEIIDAFVKGI